MPDLRDKAMDRLIGRDTSVGTAFRRKRWEMLLEVFPDIAAMRVLDIGGESQFWRFWDVHPAQVTMVNTFEQEADEPWMTARAGDGCDLPKDLGEFDLVHSNSVIEHVGGHWRRERFADEVRRSASRYWVQTPNRYFPIEPHFLMPFFQHMPRAVQTRLAMAWPIGASGWEKERVVVRRLVLDIELVSETEMRHYFPDADIMREHLAGLTKSFIAVRR